MRFCLLFAAMMASLLACTLPSAAADPADVQKLLDIGWETSLSARQAADKHFQAVSASAPADSRLQAAYWLVLLHQQKYVEAAEQIDEYLELQPASRQGLYAKTWTQAVLKRHRDALVSADRLAEAAFNQKPATSAPQQDQDDLIRFLGRLHGYLSGPLGKEFDASLRARAEERILGRLDDRQKALFAEAQVGVQKRHEELIADRKEAAEDAQKSAEEDKEQTQEKLQAQLPELAERGKKIEEQRKDAKTRLDNEIQGLQQQDIKLAADERQIRQEYSRNEQDLRRHNADINRYLGNNNGNNGNKGGGNADPRLSNAQRQARTSQAALDRLTAQMQQVQNQRNGLGLLRNQAQKTFNDFGRQLDNDARNLAAEKKKIENRLERNANSKIPQSSGQTASLDSKAKAFTTYDQFPLDEYKEKIIESLKPKR